MGIPLDKAELLALFLECIVYGIFLTFFIMLVVISFARAPIRIANQRFVLPVATVMMVLAITHLVLDFTRVMQAFVTGDQTRLPSPIGYYGNIANSLHVVKTIIYVLQTILGDGVLVWRCYIVNDRSLYVIVPAAVALLANLSIGMVVAWSMSIAVPGVDIFQTAAHFIESFFIITMGLNFCCTVAIVVKIWEGRQRLTSHSGRSLLPVMTVIVESGAIYTASVMALLISYLVGSNGQYPALDLVTPLVGVVYCLIVLQIHFHLRLSNASSTMTNRSLTQGWRNNGAAPAYPLRNGLSVHITEHAETHADTESDLTKPKTHLSDDM